MLLVLAACATPAPDSPAPAPSAVPHPDGWLLTAWVTQVEAEGVVVGDNPAVSALAMTNAVCELDPNDGQLTWDASVGRNPQVRDVAPDGDVLALTEGRAVWLRHTQVFQDVDGDGYAGFDLGVEGALHARFVDDEAVVLSSDADCRVERFDWDDLVDGWSVPAGACATEALAVEDADVYVLDGDALYRRDVRVADVTGELLAVGDGLAVVAEDGGDDLRGVDLATGQVRWHLEVPGDLRAVAVGGGLAWAAWKQDDQLRLSAWWAADGAPFDELEVGAAVREPGDRQPRNSVLSVHPASGRALVVVDGEIVAFDPVLEE